ncbi:OB-fold domain-containing protein [Nonomuraea sp. B5E05]|uniref:Zn-ribbon domain-containing OB-fold protein n=1 Tax=Nonomuraea sp. B5E05 TaxID=3153569 RepID=UPI0032607961
MSGDTCAHRAAHGELVIQRCTGCDHRSHLPEPACPGCGGRDFRAEPASGEGVVHTFTIVHRSFAPGYQGREPYVAAWVDLREGPRAFGHVVGCAPEEVRVGMPVRVTFIDDLPHWRPA